MSRDCTSCPPSTALASSSAPGSGQWASSSRRTFFFSCSSSSASWRQAGALRPQPLGAGAVDAAVEGDHTAVGALGIAGEGPFVGLLRGLCDGAAAGVVVL